MINLDTFFTGLFVHLLSLLCIAPAILAESGSIVSFELSGLFRSLVLFLFSLSSL